MSTFDDGIQPSPEFARDIEIFDGEPWTVRGPVDDLIDLQQQAFEADRLGDRSEFGALVLEMSHIESSIGNHSEAAVYAGEAVTALEEAGQREDAIAANATLAKEHRTLDSPDLVLASLEDMIRLKVNWSGGLLDTPQRVPDAEVLPILHLLKSFTHGYRSSGLILYETGNAQYPTVPLPKGGRRPSVDAVVRLGHQFTRLNAVRGAETDDGGFDPVGYNVDMISKDLDVLWKDADYRSKSRAGRLKTILLGL